MLIHVARLRATYLRAIDGSRLVPLAFSAGPYSAPFANRTHTHSEVYDCRNCCTKRVTTAFISTETVRIGMFSFSIARSLATPLRLLRHARQLVPFHAQAICNGWGRCTAVCPRVWPSRHPVTHQH